VACVHPRSNAPNGYSNFENAYLQRNRLQRTLPFQSKGEFNVPFGRYT
jgi:site-specific DNA-adenine methylase